jgi:hypothetical protein
MPPGEEVRPPSGTDDRRGRGKPGVRGSRIRGCAEGGKLPEHGLADGLGVVKLRIVPAAQERRAGPLDGTLQSTSANESWTDPTSIRQRPPTISTPDDG